MSLNYYYKINFGQVFRVNGHYIDKAFTNDPENLIRF